MKRWERWERFIISWPVIAGMIFGFAVGCFFLRDTMVTLAYAKVEIPKLQNQADRQRTTIIRMDHNLQNIGHALGVRMIDETPEEREDSR